MKNKPLIIVLTCILSISLCTSCAKKKEEKRIQDEINGIFPTETSSSETQVSEITEIVEQIETTAVYRDYYNPTPITPKKSNTLMPANALKIDITSAYEKDENVTYQVEAVLEVNYIEFELVNGILMNSGYWLDKMILVWYRVAPADDYYDGHTEFKIFDCHTGIQKDHFILPIEYLYSYGSEYTVEYDTSLKTDTRCRIYKNRYDNELCDYRQDEALMLKNDYSYEIKKLPNDIVTTKIGEHEIHHNVNDIVDAKSGDVLVKGVYDMSYEKANERCRYALTIDDNSFIYVAYGWEWSCCFGIYDYYTGENYIVPNSNNLIPIGVRGNNIYSVSGYGGDGESVIYITDIDTLETTVLADDTTIPDDYYISTAMMSIYSEYIVLRGSDDDFMKCIVLNAKNGKIVSEFIFEKVQDMPMFFIDYLTVGFGGAGHNEFYVLDLNGLFFGNWGIK